ncbi:MAG: Stp1/IreP family PP2C-type Ser/Thr phosphatase [Nitrospiraceae bacterium]
MTTSAARTQTGRWLMVGATDIGKVRKSNQDAFFIEPSGEVFLVADGMGGHAGGDVASRLTVENFTAQTTTGARPTLTHDTADWWLRESIQAANTRIRQVAHEQPELHNMGTTIVAVALIETAAGTFAHIAHVGDSRAYLLHNGRLTQLTVDHSFVEELLRRGQITREQAAVHPDRHMLLRALGIDDVPQVDCQTQPLTPGDCLLLCTDGLTKMLTDPDIEQQLLTDAPTLQASAQRLIDTALDRGAHDNVTVVLCAENRAA